MRQLLTAPEKEEFDLRHSSSAELLREGLAGFDVTEDEFRALFRLRQRYDEQVRAADGAEVGQLLGLWVSFQGEVGQVLGAERFALFDQAQNNGLRELQAKGVNSSSALAAETNPAPGL